MTRLALLKPSLGLLVVLFSIAPAFAGPSKKGDKLSKSEVMEKVRSVYVDLAGNSDPGIRRLVFLGQVELGKKDRKQAIEIGVKDTDTFIRATALTLGIKGGNKKLRKAASEALAKLLESGEQPERDQAFSLIEKHFKKKQVVKFLLSAAKLGKPDARAAARQKLIDRGGKLAWGIVQEGLSAKPDEPEYKQALEALRNFRGKEAYKWAITQVHSTTEVGRVAREYLVGLKSSKLSKAMDKALKKAYVKEGLKDDEGDKFMRRLRLGSIIGQRGDSKLVMDTLLATFSPDWTPPQYARVMAFKGLKHLRTPKVFIRMISKRRKYRFVDVITKISDQTEADAAFDWLKTWARESANPTVIKVFRRCVKSDRDVVRIAGLSGLAAVRHREGRDLFNAALSEVRVPIRAAGAEGLGAIARQGDIKELGKTMNQDPADEVKLVLINALAKLGVEEIIRPLGRVIKHKNTEIRGAAAKAMAGTGSPKAITYIGLLLRDINMDVRFLAWKLMLRLDQKRALRDFKASAVTWMTPEQIRSLGNDDKAPSALLEIISLKGNEGQRELAVAALKARGKDGATRLLSVFLKSRKRDTAAQSLEALADVRKKESVRTYMEAVKHDFPSVRAVALGALGTYGPKGVLSHAIARLEDNDPRVRANAAMASLKLSRRKY